MTTGYTKHRTYAQPIETGLPYETIYRIARMHIVDDKSIHFISMELNIQYGIVRKIVETRQQHNIWIDAIAALGREGLIQ